MANFQQAKQKFILPPFLRLVDKPLLIVLSLIVLSISAPSEALTIEQAWQAAKVFDPSYEKAQINSRIGAADIRSSRSALLPSLSANGASNWNDSGKSRHGYSISLSQSIWDSAKWSGLDAAQASLLSAQLTERQSQNDLAEKLINAYLELAQTYGDLQLAQQKLAEGQKMLKITEQRYAAGVIMATEVEDMRANHVDEQADILQKSSEIETLQAALVALINQVPDAIDEISTTSLQQPAMRVKSIEEWLLLARNSSPELLVAQQQLKVSEHQYQQAKAGYYPSLQGSLSYSDVDDRHDELSAELSLTLPIDLNGATRAAVDRASLLVYRAKQDIRMVEINIKQRISSHFKQLQCDWQRVEMAQQQVLSREKALHSKQQVYDSGQVDATDVITAHNNLFNAKNSLQSLLYQYWRHRVSLLKSAGQLDEDSIKQISRALES